MTPEAAWRDRGGALEDKRPRPLAATGHWTGWEGGTIKYFGLMLCVEGSPSQVKLSYKGACLCSHRPMCPHFLWFVNPKEGYS